MKSTQRNVNKFPEISKVLLFALSNVGSRPIQCKSINILILDFNMLSHTYVIHAPYIILTVFLLPMTYHAEKIKMTPL